MCNIIHVGGRLSLVSQRFKIGTMPGAGGGTQRLTRATRKSRALEMNLTGLSLQQRQQAMVWCQKFLLQKQWMML